MVTVALSITFSLGRFSQLHRQISDVFFLSRAGNPDVSKDVVIIGIDDKSVVELRPYGRLFYWPRSLYADVVRVLTDGRARVIAFDVLFDAAGEGDDDLFLALEAAQSRAVNVVMPSAGDPLARRDRGRTALETYDDLFEPLPAVVQRSAGVGMVNQLPDTDGTVRRVPLVFDVHGVEYPSFALISVAKFLRRPTAWDGPITPGVIPLAGREIPIDSNGATIVNFNGGPHKSAPRAFPIVSFVDVLYGRVPPEMFSRKLVFVGLTATGFADDYWTPTSISGKMDGVEIHANAADTLLRAEFIREAPGFVTIALILGFSVLAALVLVSLPPLVAALICVLALVGYSVAASAYFDQVGIIMNLVFPFASLLLTYAGIALYRVIVEQGQSRALRGVLSQYLSPSVVAEVTRDPDSLKLGGDEREMTVLFSDLRGFTSISETMDPETLVHLLTEYLTVMSDIVFKHQGTIDKYMGDAIMAFWGAPQHQPNHAELALRASLDMVHELDRLNEKWRSEGRAPLAMGVGLSTGVMKVGNMGSASRFDYTVIGDAVNLGSRLESLNKTYGTTLIVSGTTMKEAGTWFHARFLDLVAVKGKKDPVEVFEIMTTETALGPRTADTLRAYEAGIAAYRERDWLSAAARFQEALRYDPEDGPSALYLQRCESLLHEPPPADWDGVFVMTEK